jgi:hypothetical protein
MGASQKNSNKFGFSFDLHYLCRHDEKDRLHISPVVDGADG